MAGTTGTCYRWRAKFLEWSGTYKWVSWELEARLTSCLWVVHRGKEPENWYGPIKCWPFHSPCLPCFLCQNFNLITFPKSFLCPKVQYWNTAALGGKFDKCDYIFFNPIRLSYPNAIYFYVKKHTHSGSHKCVNVLICILLNSKINFFAHLNTSGFSVQIVCPSNYNQDSQTHLLRF